VGRATEPCRFAGRPKLSGGGFQQSPYWPNQIVTVRRMQHAKIKRSILWSSVLLIALQPLFWYIASGMLKVPSRSKAYGRTPNLCFISGNRYACTTVPQHVVRSECEPSPNGNCLPGGAAWEICSGGQFLCQIPHEGHNSSQEISGCILENIYYRCISYSYQEDFPYQCLSEKAAAGVCDEGFSLCLDKLMDPDDGRCVSDVHSSLHQCFLNRVILDVPKNSRCFSTRECSDLRLMQLQSKSQFPTRLCAGYCRIQVVHAETVPDSVVHWHLPGVILEWKAIPSTNMFHVLLLVIHPLFKAMRKLAVPHNNTLLLLDSHSNVDLQSPFLDLLGLFSANPPVPVTVFENQSIFFDHVLIGVSGGSWAGIDIFKPNLPSTQVDMTWRYLKSFVLKAFSIHPSRATTDACVLVMIQRRSRSVENWSQMVEAVNRTVWPTAQICSVRLEEISFQKQVDLVSRARHLLGMHGAGLTHMIFLGAPGSVLELFPHRANLLAHPSVCYRNLALAVGVHHFHVHGDRSACTTADPRSCTDNFFNVHTVSRVVDLAISTVGVESNLIDRYGSRERLLNR
jgi:hypothetical protein